MLHEDWKKREIATRRFFDAGGKDDYVRRRRFYKKHQAPPLGQERAEGCQLRPWVLERFDAAIARPFIWHILVPELSPEQSS
jgi:hypothetical protein